MLEAVLHQLFELDITQWMHDASVLVIALGLIVGVLMLGKSADVLVDQATELSLRIGLPEVIVGATIVSLGTTTPEAVVSVMAAIGGTPGLALGNAVGSIICDTGLILGLACLIAPIPIDRWLVNRQGMIQFAAGLLLVAACVPWGNLAQINETGGSLGQRTGFVFLGLLAAYIIWSIRVAKSRGAMATHEHDPEIVEEEMPEKPRPIIVMLVMLLVATFFVVISSEILIASAIETASRLSVPEGVIAATLVAFGTSLPELTIAVTASLKGRGELAIGNVIGADILNVLFVAGAAAAVTPMGLTADPVFFQVQFPAMIAVLVTFRIAIMFSRGDQLPRWAGSLLVGFYAAYLIFTFAMR